MKQPPPYAMLPAELETSDGGVNAFIDHNELVEVLEEQARCFGTRVLDVHWFRSLFAALAAEEKYRRTLKVDRTVTCAGCGMHPEHAPFCKSVPVASTDAD